MEETLTGERNLAGELLRIVPRSLLYTHALLPHKRGMLSILSPPYTNPDLSSLAGGKKQNKKQQNNPTQIIRILRRRILMPSKTVSYQKNKCRKTIREVRDTWCTMT